jgi:hypothetical protein
MASRLSGRDSLAHASFAACLPAERALIGCCSMDGKGTWRDNVFVERFWRTIKYEEVYLRAYGASKKHGNQSAATSPSTTQGDFTQPLTAAPRIKPTLTRCRSARQHNPRPTIRLPTRKFYSKDRGHFRRSIRRLQFPRTNVCFLPLDIAKQLFRIRPMSAAGECVRCAHRRRRATPRDFFKPDARSKGAYGRTGGKADLRIIRA